MPLTPLAERVSQEVLVELLGIKKSENQAGGDLEEQDFVGFVV